MFKKLRNRLILLVLSGTIFSILLVMILHNITMFNNFDKYMINEQKDRVDDIIETIVSTYSIDNSWTNKVLENIIISPIISEYDVIIKDLDENVVFTHYMETNMMGMHMNKMAPMMNWKKRDESYVLDNFDLRNKDQKIGTVQIGYNGPFILSERDVQFYNNMFKSIIYAGIISIVVAIILGIFSSKLFTKPILKINEAAIMIRKGMLDTHVEIPNNITELRELSKSINHLAYSLKEQNILRKRLTSDISHELRTPLTILQSHIDAFVDGIWEPTPERLDIFKNEVTRLIKLVEQLKNLTDIESHKIILEIEEFNLSDLINKIVESFRYQLESKNIDFSSKIEKELIINADKDKITQIIINLLSNTYKFTPSNGKVEVLLKEYDDNILISFKDTGIGIPKKDIPYIFERFCRSEKSRNRKSGGAGIGLTITKTLVEAHGGEINVQSQEGKGSEFIVKLPKNLN